MILRENHFWVANSDFTTSTTFNQLNWSKYDRHDYSIFNPVHTWIEFINRLIGALSGIPILILAVLSVISVRKNPINAILSMAVLFLLLFEAWLGKTVVDGNLVPNQITIHMMGSVVIVLLLLMLRARNEIEAPRLPKIVVVTLLTLLVLTITQIFLGTQTRELVDAAMDNGMINRIDIIPGIESSLPEIHRSFAWLVLVVASILVYAKRVTKTDIPGFNALVFGIGLEWTVGLVLYFLGLPEVMQPVHLVLSIAILSSISYPLFLSVRKT
jgi:cytochrome c oxidase assembly protein subunit 15